MAEIPLRARDGTIRAIAHVDDEDHEQISHWTWRLARSGYAVRGEKPGGCYQTIYMHRAIMGLEHGDTTEVDHISRDRLDNRRANLRLLERGLQRHNQGATIRPGRTSKYRGVRFHRRLGWHARATLRGQHHHLGYWPTELDAAVAAAAWRLAFMDHAVEDLLDEPEAQARLIAIGRALR